MAVLIARALVLVLLLAAPAAAQDTTPVDLTGNVALSDSSFAWATHQHAADVTSSVLVGGQLGAAVVAGWRAPDRKAALGCLGFRLGVTVAAAETVKWFVHRDRPDRSDDHSFYSEHTGLLFAAAGWRWAISLPIAIGGGYLRMAAGKHYATDVLVGAGAGLLARQVCHT